MSRPGRRALLGADPEPGMQGLDAELECGVERLQWSRQVDSGIAGGIRNERREGNDIIGQAKGGHRGSLAVWQGGTQGRAKQLDVPGKVRRIDGQRD